MKRYHIPYIRPAFPSFPRLKYLELSGTNVFEWEFRFTDSSRYTLPGKDQYDYNKLCGLSFEPIMHSRTNSVMAGWCYDPIHNIICVSPYLHDLEGHVTYDPPSKAAQINLNRTYTLRISVTRDIKITRDVDEALITFEIFDEKWTQVYRATFSRKFATPTLKARTITTWFGGNRLPRKFIPIHLSSMHYRHAPVDVNEQEKISTDG